VEDLTFTIPEVPPSLNRVLRMHWRKRVKLNNNWKLWVRSQMDCAPRCPPGRKMRCTVTLHHSRFYDDCDNRNGACKPLFDALKHWNLILDDSRDFLEATVEQAKCSHRTRHTIVELEAM